MVCRASTSQIGGHHAAVRRIDENAGQVELAGNFMGEVDGDGGGPTAAGDPGNGDDPAGGHGQRRTMRGLDARQGRLEVLQVQRQRQDLPRPGPVDREQMLDAAVFPLPGPSADGR